MPSDLAHKLTFVARRLQGRPPWSGHEAKEGPPGATICSHPVEGYMNRRQAITLLGSGTGFALVNAFGGSLPAFAQPGGWYAAKSAKDPSFRKGTVIRTILKDIPPEALGNGSVQFHEH